MLSRCLSAQIAMLPSSATNGDASTSSSNGNASAASSSASSTSSIHTAPARTLQTKRTEQLMSFSWFIGLHIPILYVLLTGNTTLARSIWSEASWNDTANDPNSSMAPPKSHPSPQGPLYIFIFFSLLFTTGCMYFTAALSYPGYVGTEWNIHKFDEKEKREKEGGVGGGDVQQKQQKNGYARVDQADSNSSMNGDVRIDIRRIEVSPDSNHSMNGASSTNPSSSYSSSSIPASALGEASEAAELSIGCTPPVAQPILRTLGLSRAQIHVADQTVNESESSEFDNWSRQVNARLGGDEITNGEGESSPLTTNVDRGDALSSAYNGASASRTNPSSSHHHPRSQPQRRANNSPANGYCTLCNLVRPARAKHCYKCKACVTKFDHHCPFVANCLGHNNHRYFLIYLWCQMSTMIWGLSLNCEPFLYNDSSKSKLYGHGALMILMFGQLMVSGMLCFFHTWLALTNQTTYQVIKMQEQGMSQTPEARAVRKRERKERNRKFGDHSDEDEDDDEEDPDSANLAAEPLTWSTYHIGFFCNIFTFCLGRLPDQHRLPRAVKGRDGTWTYLPHAQQEEMERVQRKEQMQQQQQQQVEMSAIPSSSSIATLNSTIVHLSYNGHTLPTTQAEVTAFPDTPPTQEVREAYTRPAKIVSASSSAAKKATYVVEPDTDEEEEEKQSVEL